MRAASLAPARGSSGHLSTHRDSHARECQRATIASNLRPAFNAASAGNASSASPRHSPRAATTRAAGSSFRRRFGCAAATCVANSASCLRAAGSAFSRGHRCAAATCAAGSACRNRLRRAATISAAGPSFANRLRYSATTCAAGSSSRSHRCYSATNRAAGSAFPGGLRCAAARFAW